MIDYLLGNGVTIVCCLACQPEWSMDGGEEAKHILRQRGQDNLITVLPSKPEFWPDYERWLDAAAKRYADKIRYWELWNEPDGMAGLRLIRGDDGKVKDIEYGGEPAWYFEYMRRSAPIIRRNIPDALIAAGALESKSGLETDFMEKMYALGARPYFDALSIHCYGSAGGYPFNTKWLRRMRAFLDEHGDRDKTMWVTEYDIHCGRVSDRRRAYRVARRLRVLRQIPWITISHGHIHNALWDGNVHEAPARSTLRLESFRAMTQETGPRHRFARNFEGPALQLLRDWEWDVQGATGGQVVDGGIRDGDPHSGERYLLGQSGAGAVRLCFNVYVGAPDPGLRFWYQLLPENTDQPVTLSLTLLSDNIGYDAVTVPVLQDKAPVGRWAQARVRLNRAVPKFAGLTIIELSLLATVPEGKLSFGLDDLVLE